MEALQNPSEGWVHPYGHGGRPGTWLIYAVVEVDSIYYPLAAISYLDKDFESRDFSTFDLFQVCREVLSSLSDPIHRDAIDTEIRSAQSFYSKTGRGRKWLAANSIKFAQFAPPPFTPASVIWERQINLLSAKVMEEPCPFPYSLSQLLRGACRAQTRSAFSSLWGPVPVTTTYNGTNDTFGAVIIDVTDLENIGCGFVAPLVNSFYFEAQPWQTEPTAIEDVPKEVLTAAEYNAQFGVWSERSSQTELSNDGEVEMHEKESVDFFKNLRCPQVDGMSVIWPNNILKVQYNPRKRAKVRKSLTSMALAAIVREAEHVQQVDHKILQELRKRTHLKHEIYEALVAHSSQEDPSHAIAQLASIAFDGCTDARMFRIKGLSLQHLLELSGFEGLSRAQSISFYVDQAEVGPLYLPNEGKGDADMNQLFETLAKMRCLSTIRVVQNPASTSRKNDTSMLFGFLRDLLENRHKHALLKKIVFHVLHTVSWTWAWDTPESTMVPLFDAITLSQREFPVATIYWGWQVERSERWFRESYIDHMLLDPEALVARLLTCHGGTRHDWPAEDAFAYGPDRLKSMSVIVPKPHPNSGKSQPSRFRFCCSRGAPQKVGLWTLVMSLTEDFPQFEGIPAFEDFMSHHVEYAFVRMVTNEPKAEFEAASAIEFLAKTLPAAGGELTPEKRDTIASFQRTNRIFPMRTWNPGEIANLFFTHGEE